MAAPICFSAPTAAGFSNPDTEIAINATER